jgi:NAD(P)-dependent dehydrogenase (short-subunit alcohol dehydrogenase family)
MNSNEITFTGYGAYHVPTVTRPAKKEKGLFTCINHFKDKVVIIADGTSGIGRGLGEKLSRRGATVIFAGKRIHCAEEIAQNLQSSGYKAEATHLDVTDQTAVEQLVRTTFKRHGRLDYMFNNAATGSLSEAGDINLEHWQRVFDVNLWGVIYGTRAAYEVMITQGFGHIVNISSLVGLVPLPMLTSYSTTKHTLVGLSTLMGAEAVKYGVKVSVVCPGAIRTRGFEKAHCIKINREKALFVLLSLPMMDTITCTRAILRDVIRNKSIITVALAARVVPKRWAEFCVYRHEN